MVLDTVNGPEVRRSCDIAPDDCHHRSVKLGIIRSPTFRGRNMLFKQQPVQGEQWYYTGAGVSSAKKTLSLYVRILRLSSTQFDFCKATILVRDA